MLRRVRLALVGDRDGAETLTMGEQTAAKIIARFIDGRVLKGHTRNFDPERAIFTLHLIGAPQDAEPMPIRLTDLKAVFFVKDFDGEPRYSERKAFITPAPGRRLSVRFNDGEVLVGTSLTYNPLKTGFFLFPADRFSNNDKAFIVAASIAEVTKLP